jgi:hypothetical protein
LQIIVLLFVPFLFSIVLSVPLQIIITFWRLDITEILLKVAFNTINQVIKLWLRNTHVDTLTNTYMTPLSWFGEGTSIKSGGVKIRLRPKPPLWVKWCGHASALHMWVKYQSSHVGSRHDTWIYEWGLIKGMIRKMTCYDMFIIYFNRGNNWLYQNV